MVTSVNPTGGSVNNNPTGIPIYDNKARTSTYVNQADGSIVRDTWRNADGSGGQREVFNADGKTSTVMDGKTTKTNPTNGIDAAGAVGGSGGNAPIDGEQAPGPLATKEAKIEGADPSTYAKFIRQSLADGSRGLNQDGKAAISKDGTGGKFDGDMDHSGQIDNTDVEKYIEMSAQQAAAAPAPAKPV
jgi:hypothetical protein